VSGHRRAHLGSNWTTPEPKRSAGLSRGTSRLVTVYRAHCIDAHACMHDAGSVQSRLRRTHLPPKVVTARTWFRVVYRRVVLHMRGTPHTRARRRLVSCTIPAWRPQLPDRGTAGGFGTNASGCNRGTSARLLVSGMETATPGS